MVFVARHLMIQLDDDAESVEDGLPVVVEGAQRQVVVIAIAEAALLPFFVDFLIGEVLVLSQRIHKLSQVFSKVFHNQLFQELRQQSVPGQIPNP